MGLATGCVGMSVSDFERCTPSEFRAVWDAWQGREMRRERTSWEQTRTVCVSLLQPYAKKALRGVDVLRFPWDEAEESQEAAAQEQVETREELRARYREAIKQAGLR